jgi:hypothetical protein
MYRLKKTGMLGIVEAQHNLAIEYLNGEDFKKNVKSLTQFLHERDYGSPQSKVL